MIGNNGASLLLVFVVVFFVNGMAKHVKRKPPVATTIVHLSDTNFKTYSASKEFLLVDFSTKWCGFCKKFAPKFEDAASRLRKKLPQVELAAVDCQSDGKATCEELGIKVVPTIYLFLNGRKANEFNRYGDADGIVNFMSDAVQKKKDEASKITKHVKQDDVSKTNNNSVAANPQKDLGMHSAVYKLSERNYDWFVNQKTASLVEFYAPWCTHCKLFAPIYEKAAHRLYRKLPQVQLGKVNCVGSGKTICVREKINLFPTLWLFQDGRRIKEYKGARSSKSLVKFMYEYVHHPGLFMDQHKDKTLSKINNAVCKAADQPKANTAATRVLTFTDNNFTLDVLKHKVTLVEFYAPWCPHCMKFKEPYSEAAAILHKVRPQVALAKVNCYGSGKKTCEEMKVSAFPTIMLFTQGESRIRQYDGPRDTKSIVRFIKDVLKNPNNVGIQNSADNSSFQAVQNQCKATEEACADQTLAQQSAIAELTDANFLSAISSQKLTLVDFYTGWCCDCKAFSPAFEEAAARSKYQMKDVKFARINCADAGKVTCKSVGVSWYPTVLLYKSGHRVSELKTGKSTDAVMQFVQNAYSHQEALQTMSDPLAGLH